MKTNPSQSDLPKLSAPAQRALASVGITRLSDLGKFTEAEIANLHGIGPNALKALKEAMAKNGLEFKKPAPKK
ncbi:MAG TPA: hypothetical protein PLJ62_06980 [Thermoflexales bacterium]|nr:hypothetical protein [Thermoflexales bacterium]HQW34915.1 hypothetical protein [Thermoflexales bacterium]HQX76942.1 hypothetical protein [Thermoflexales bacterium]HQZ99921.1 hypothetical protein [Thermoflexales bacterium]